MSLEPTQPILEDTLGEPIVSPEPLVETFQQQVAAAGPEFVNNPNISKHESLASLLKSHVHVQDFVGRDKIAKPNKDDIHDVNRYLTETGRPEEVGGYNSIELPEGVADNIGWDGSFETKINQAVFDSGITADSHDILLPKLIGLLQNEAQAMYDQGEHHAAETIQGLQKKYGTTLHAKMDSGERALKRFFPGWAEFRDKQFMDGTRVGNTIEFLDAMIAMGDRWEMDDESNPGQGPRVSRGIDPATALSQISQKEADPQFREKWLNVNHPQHKEAIAELDRLYEFAHPEPK